MSDQAFEAVRNFDTVHKIARINPHSDTHNKDECDACQYLDRYNIEKIEKKFAGKVYSITGRGWLTEIMKNLNEEVDCVIKIEGEDAGKIIKRIDDSIRTIPVEFFPDYFADMMKRWEENFKKGASFFIAPEMIILVFGSIGAFGGAFGSVLWCIGLANKNNMSISLKNIDSILYIVFGSRR